MSSAEFLEPTPKRRYAIIWVIVGIVLLTILLRVPGRPSELVADHWFRLPLEVPLCVLAFLFLRGKAFAVTRLALVCLVSVLLLLRLADLISRTAFGRAFSPLAEWHLIGQGWSLTAKTLGKAEAIGFASVGIFLLILVAVLLYRGLGYLTDLSAVSRRRTLFASVAVSLIGAILMGLQHYHSRDYRVELVGLDELYARIQYTRNAIRNQAEFSEFLASDSIADSKPDFAALEGLDVIILYVESYGRSFVDSPQFFDRAAVRLDSVETEIVEAGLSIKSGWVDSPIRGGRSWLAHGTVASGLPLTDHARFDRLISSDRKSLAVLFKEAGWTTSVVLPVVQEKWVEGAWYQVDRFFDRDALDYKGQDFGFVTMPDQYTLSTFERQVRATAEGPLMAHIGLLDSHAPWGPLPVHLPWDTVTDGSVFDGSQRHGGRHSWANPVPVRKAYGQAVDQTLKLVGEYLALYAEDALFIIVGDHQPPSVIAGWAPSSEVPIHVVSSNAALLERLPALNFRNGMTPASDSPAFPMQSIRGLLATVYEEPLE